MSCSAALNCESQQVLNEAWKHCLGLMQDKQVQQSQCRCEYSCIATCPHVRKKEAGHAGRGGHSRLLCEFEKRHEWVSHAHAPAAAAADGAVGAEAEAPDCS